MKSPQVDLNQQQAQLAGHLHQHFHLPAGKHSRRAQVFEQNQSPKMAATSVPLMETSSLQRRLFSMLYLYAILVISLYLTYVAYHFYQQQRWSQASRPGEPPAEPSRLVQVAKTDEQPPEAKAQQELEGKVHLLERYIEMIALDLQETNRRLREREKCDCSVSCTFNGTRYADRSSWQNQCDLCTCQLGKISCLPRKCPAISCDDAVQLPGQCCPSCMKKCKHNGKLVRHGQKFKPLDSSRKECKCQDGLIKCDQVPVLQLIKPKQTTPTQRPNATAQTAERARSDWIGKQPH